MPGLIGNKTMQKANPNARIAGKLQQNFFCNPPFLLLFIGVIKNVL
jgi:hypothetical protein